MITVIHSAPMCSVQDLGRHGYRDQGICQSGAIDFVGMQQANMLVGNEPGAAVLEIRLAPVHLQFTEDSVISLMGADFHARVQDRHGETLPGTLVPGYAHLIQEGCSLLLPGPQQQGVPCYLAVSGGIDVPRVLGSRSTDLSAAFGGFQGRYLKAGDRLPVGRATSEARGLRQGIRPLQPSYTLRALAGPDYEAFEAQSGADFWQEKWVVTEQSNRMGLRLDGSPLRLQQTMELISAGVLPGMVQVPPDGKPIILANDAQTTGGYPRIATVINADLWQLAYLPPASTLQFSPVSLKQARLAMTQQREMLYQQQQQLVRSGTAP